MTLGAGAVGELTYNGYTFNGATHVTISETPVQDEAQRTVIYNQIRIEVVSIVTDLDSSASSTLDDEMQNIRQRLSKQGQKLVLKDKGFGSDIIVNGGGQMRDVKHGPVPGEFRWVPVGGDRTAEITWSVTTCIPVCSGARFDGVMALNASFSYRTNAQGSTERTISGYIEIANTRQGTKTRDHIDDYFAAVFSDMPPNYKRTIDREVSADQSRIDFTINDRPVSSEKPFPLHIADARGTHRASVSRKAMCNWHNEISMQLEPKAGVSGTYAMTVFLALVAQRIQQAKQAGKSPILTDISIEESIWARTSSFSVRYWFLASIVDIVGASGMWKQLGHSWSQWQSTMTQMPKAGASMFGRQQLTTDTPTIIDLCLDSGSTSSLSAYKFDGHPNPGISKLINNETPAPAESFMEYELVTVPYRKRQVARQSVLQAADDEFQAHPDMESPSRFDYGPRQGTDDVLQESGQPRYGVRLVASATRVGHEIPRPQILQANGEVPVELESKWIVKQVGSLQGVPVYRAAGSADYSLSNSPGKVSGKQPAGCLTQSAGGGGGAGSFSSFGGGASFVGSGSSVRRS